MSSALRVAIDARHLRDFGIGTHIRNLLENLPSVGVADVEYSVVVRKNDQPEIPPGLRTVVYDHPDQDRLEDIRFPMFLRSLGADIYHAPLNAVPIFMPYALSRMAWP